MREISTRTEPADAALISLWNGGSNAPNFRRSSFRRSVLKAAIVRVIANVRYWVADVQLGEGLLVPSYAHRAGMIAA